MTRKAGAQAPRRRTKGPSGPAASRQAKVAAAAPRSTGPSRTLVAAVVGVVVVVAVAAAVAIGMSQRSERASAGGSALPPGVSAMGEGFVANANAPIAGGAPTLDVYEDFQCPACKVFEDRMGASVRELAADGKVRLTYHVMTFLDRNLDNDSSTRAANAAFCAVAPGRFQEFHDATYAGQPAREGQGWTDAELRGFAESSGIAGAELDTWASCYSARSHNQYVESVQEETAKDGVTGTPTVRLNGTNLDLSTLTPESLTQAVADATR